MSSNLIQIKSFLGKYYSELNYSATQEKYEKTELDTIFEQRYLIQDNKLQMIVDPSLRGLIVTVAGNEIHISKEFYDHPNIVITNSLEDKQAGNIRALYQPEVFSTVAYLICQNQTIFQIIGELDEPLYVRYRSDYETFYNSIVTFDVCNDISIEIVEEIESTSALNIVANYILHPSSTLKLSTFYQNHLSGISYMYRNISARDNSTFSHMLFGKGSSNIIDENKLLIGDSASAEFTGIVNSNKKNFHSILYTQPETENYSLIVEYRDVLSGPADISFFPVILGQRIPENSSISISNIAIDDIPKEELGFEIDNYLSNIVEKATLDRMIGTQRFYENKTKFMHFL